MLPLPIDMIVIVGTYVILKLTYDLFEQSQRHWISLRIFASATAYLLAAALIDFVINYFSLCYEVITGGSAKSILSWVFLTMITGLLIRGYHFMADKLKTDEMGNFIVDALLLRSYFRMRDVDLQEQIGTFRMKKLYREVHGNEFSHDVISTPFDRVKDKSKKTPAPEPLTKKKKYPPDYQSELSQLKAKKVTNVSASWCFELFESPLHPLLPLMQNVIIDPVKMKLELDILFPEEKIVTTETQGERIRLIEKVYQAIQILIDQEWFALYAPFISTVEVICKQKELNDEMKGTSRPLMRWTMAYHTLRLRASRITPASEIEKLAEIQFF